MKANSWEQRRGAHRLGAGNDVRYDMGNNIFYRTGVRDARDRKPRHIQTKI